MSASKRNSRPVARADDLIERLYRHLETFDFQAGDMEKTGLLYDQLTKIIIEGFGGHAGCIVFVDGEDGEDAKQFDRIYAHGYGENFIWWSKLDNGEGAVWRTIRKGVPTTIFDVTADQDYVPLNVDTVSQMNIPILSEERVTGAMVVEFPKALSPDAGILIEKTSRRLQRFIVRLEEQIFRVRGETVLAQIEKIGDAASEDEALKIIIAAMELVVGSGEVAILRRTAGQLSVAGYANIDALNLPKMVPIGDIEHEGYTSYVAHLRIPVYCRETIDDKSYPYYREVVKATRSQYTVPLVFRRELVGVLNVGSKQPYAFSQTDRKLVSSLARHAAHALYYQRLLGEIGSISRMASEKLKNWPWVKDDAYEVRNGKQRVAAILDGAISQAQELISLGGHEFRAGPVETTIDLRERLSQSAVERLAQAAATLNFSFSSDLQVDAAPCHISEVTFDQILNSLISAVRLETAGAKRENVVITLREKTVTDGANGSRTKYYIVEIRIDDPTGVFHKVIDEKNYDALLSPRAENWYTAEGASERPHLWLCDRLLAGNGGYLDITVSADSRVVLTAHFRA